MHTSIGLFISLFVMVSCSEYSGKTMKDYFDINPDEVKRIWYSGFTRDTIEYKGTEFNTIIIDMAKLKRVPMRKFKAEGKINFEMKNGEIYEFRTNGKIFGPIEGRYFKSDSIDVVRRNFR